MVRCMCQVARELPARPFVTLATGFNHVVPAQGRIGIGRAENIVGAVAVGTFGNTLATQARDLAVECVEECLRLFFMTAAALFHHLCPETYLFRAHDRVRRMTIFTGGKFFVGNRVSGPVNTLPELLLDTVVAGTAGSRYVLRISRGVWIIRWKFIVCTVAIGASRRHNKAAFNQSAAVHAVLVTTDDVIDLGMYPRCGLLPYAMTIPAQCRNIERIGWRCR